MSIIILYPYFVMFTTALKSRAEIYASNGTVFPINWVWSNFTDIWSKAPLLRYFLNSVLVAGGSTCIAILCGIPAAYALARMKFKGQKFFLGLVIVSQMFSPVVLLIGIYRVMSTLHLTDSLLGLIFINAAFNQAFAIWLLRGTFVSISPDMEQAARIDGCNKVQAMIKVLLPMAAPGIVTTLIFIFINAWNEYTIALTLISSDVNKPLTVGITIFNGYNMIEWQYLFAASLFATIPVIVLFMCIEKHLVSGLASGGVKG
jgi:multiple sugar transport system permease protein